MKLLLDTCAFLWFQAEAPELSSKAMTAICDPANEIYLSAVSAWEIGRKWARGDLTLPARPEVLIPEVRAQSGICSLSLSEQDALMAEKLPLFHKDPFDRMLVAQAILNAMTVVTPDRAFALYPVPVLW